MTSSWFFFSTHIQKEYLERDRVVQYVIDIIIIHINPDGGECESSDTEDRSDCSSSEDMDL